MGRAAVLAIAAIMPLAGCTPLASNRCLSAGQPGSAAYQSCMQADYADAMQEMDYRAWLELTKGQIGQ
jgi:hypothetical protein